MLDRTYIFVVYLLVSSFSGFAQDSSSELVAGFSAKCSEPISSDAKTPEFRLIKYHTARSTTILRFDVAANCGQINRGTLVVSADTLIIADTDLSLATDLVTMELDSSGNQLEVTTTTYDANYTFCDCIISFAYELSTPLADLSFLRFHGRTFQLTRTE
ncbi:hypothetical protein RT717_03725 [Imperialibacter roseus]|uniref:Uncharacterized protein n=1 Tax=Imperialibacter roseus TaxID=1324217 RepID=A0ABZ0IVR6_9BACT|nr:hypothetical protein [Imperialibacter roseus]WOK07732.1 hypothetical protein RT717_03725 [Imperialibacter roseus]